MGDFDFGRYLFGFLKEWILGFAIRMSSLVNRKLANLCCYLMENIFELEPFENDVPHAVSGN